MMPLLQQEVETKERRFGWKMVVGVMVTCLVVGVVQLNGRGASGQEKTHVNVEKQVGQDYCTQQYYCMKYGRKCWRDLGFYSIRNSIYNAHNQACESEASGHSYALQGQKCNCRSAACQGPRCGDVHAPNCPLTDAQRAVCTSPIVEEMYDTGTTVGNVMVAVDVGSALLSIVPLLKETAGAVPVVGDILAAILGFTGNMAMTGEAAYNLMLAKLAEEVAYLHRCIDHRFAVNRVQNINASLRAVKTDLARAQLSGPMNAASRINQVWQPSSQFCDRVMTDIQTFVTANTAHAEDWLPLLSVMNGALELCVSLWTGYMVDIRESASHNMNIEKVSMRDFAWEVRDVVTRGVDDLDAYWHGMTVCGYPNSARAKANEAVRTLEKNLMMSVFSMHESTLGGIVHNAVVLRYVHGQGSLQGSGNPESRDFLGAMHEEACVKKCLSSQKCSAVNWKTNGECNGVFNGIGNIRGYGWVFNEIAFRGEKAGVSFYNHVYLGYADMSRRDARSDVEEVGKELKDGNIGANAYYAGTATEGDCNRGCAHSRCAAALWVSGHCYTYSGYEAISMPTGSVLQVFLHDAVVVRLNKYSWSGKNRVSYQSMSREYECLLMCASMHDTCVGLDWVASTGACYVYTFGAPSPYPGTDAVRADSTSVHYDVLLKNGPLPRVLFDDPVPNSLARARERLGID